MNRQITRWALLASLLLAPNWIATGAKAQPTTDARDYEGAGSAPNNTFWVHNYLRHQTTTQKRNLTTNLAIFRAGYLLKFGKLAFVPFEAVLPVVDADLKWYQSTTPNANPMLPPTTSFGTRRTATSGPGAGSIRQTGFSDLQFFPSLIYTHTEDEATRTHTYFGATFYTYIPIGTYSSNNAPLNIGENRWSLKPQIMVGQRFAKIFTVDAVANMVAYTDNKKFHPVTALPVGKLSQKSSFNAELHLAADIHPTMYVAASYYLSALGERTYSAAVPAGLPAPTAAAIGGALAATHINAESATVHTMRFSFGIHIEKQSLLLLQYQQDLSVGGDESNTRFAGIRFTHFIF